jgi:hypothetical protein
MNFMTHGTKEGVAMRTYEYKNIVCFTTCGRWQADYMSDGKRFALHRCCTRTKAAALAIAKHEVDYLNRKENV